MNPSELTLRYAQSRVADLRRRADRERPLNADGSVRHTPTQVTIRFADSLDGCGLAALAALDSAELVQLPALVAEVEGELRAALSLVDAAVIADPFRPTLELVELLRTRAEQLYRQPRRRARAWLRAPLNAVRQLRLDLRGIDQGGP